MKTKGTKTSKTTKTTSGWVKKSKGVQLTPWGTYRTRITIDGTTYSKCFNTLKEARTYYTTMKNSLKNSL